MAVNFFVRNLARAFLQYIAEWTEWPLTMASYC
jgi:hypothetical protein